MSGKGELLTGVHLDKSQVLGEGAFGVVYRGRLGDAGVAIKTIKANSPEQAAELEATLLEEAAVWAAVQHPNVVQFYGVHKDAEGGLYLVSELMDGSVEGLLHEDGERVADGEEALLTERQQLTMCLHVACALRRLHQLKILHSDLAARNVLYKRTGGGDLVFKVTDFGLATVGRGGDGASASASRSYQLVSREQVPVRWCAPEVLKRQLYSPEADVWSLGVYMWEVFSLGELPYGLHMTNADIARDITPAKSTFRLEKPEECPEAVYELMTSCWKFGRKLRITLPEMEDKLRVLRDKHLQPSGDAMRTASPAPAARHARTASPAPAARHATPPLNRQQSPAPARLSVPGSPSSPAARRRSQSNLAQSGDFDSGEEYYVKGVQATKQGNNSVALEFYRQGSEYGHPGCQAALGKCYLEGKYVMKNETLALDLFRKAAVLGEPAAMVAMGNAYRFGVGDVVKSAQTAFEWYRKAAESGDAMGHVMVAECYSRGVGVVMNPKSAYEWAQKASKLGQGWEEGLASVGIFTYSGIGVAMDKRKAVALLKKAADAGSLRAEAQYAIAMFHGSDGVPKNEAEAAETFIRLAEAGIDVAMRNYGVMLVEGIRVPVNKELGLQWLQKAVNLQHPGAMAVMGDWMAHGAHMPKQENEGIRMLKAAAAMGSDAACVSLGNIAENRKEMKNALVWWKKAMHTNAEAAYRYSAEIVLNAPVDADLSEGLAIMERSVEMGHAAGAVILGSLYCKGVGVTKDMKRGAKWLQRGEEMGFDECTKELGLCLTVEGADDKELVKLGLDRLAKGVKNRNGACCRRLGELYAKGRFVKQDKERARKYLVLPANEGDVDAQILLAELSDELNDPRQAVKWYEKAARQKNDVAAFRLAEHVENGKGAAVNLHTAMAWYTRVDTAESHYRQGLILLRGGAGVEADVLQAASAFKRASDKGHREATYRLGLHYRDGIGMDVNKKEAVALFTNAADKGSADASFALAMCYKEGYGSLKKDKKQATYYLEAAAVAGHQEAKDLLRSGDKKSGIKRLLK